MSNATLKHIHHIVPKHMGGTDDPSNLVELTVAEHALLGRGNIGKTPRELGYYYV
jgi:hypothetical protein